MSADPRIRASRNQPLAAPCGLAVAAWPRAGQPGHTLGRAPASCRMDYGCEPRPKALYVRLNAGVFPDGAANEVRRLPLVHRRDRRAVQPGDRRHP
jgi:hypothetical protein